jgi:putative hemolysin
MVAGPMHTLSILASPFVHFLTFSTDGLLRLLRLRQVEEPPVTEEEVAAMLDAGTAAGIFDVEEHDLVERVF